MVSKKRFLKEYAKAVRKGNAAIFAGAGLSNPSGFVSWKELLRPLADDIELNIDKEQDLTMVAQLVRNEYQNRAKINEIIIENFCREAQLNENISILTRMPIYTYWTTNYDHLIEEGLRNANRRADIKVESTQLSCTITDRDVLVYKMHGDASNPAKAVLTKDDYAKYDSTHPLFRDVLKGDLISKTFLFIGFSFTDPNFDFILNQIRLFFGENCREHYCFMKRITKNVNKNDDEIIYQKVQQDLREKDLRRYGIQTVYVDEYSEITELLRELEESVLANNVFISGSAECFEGYWDADKIEALSYKLAKHLVKEDCTVTSGYGIRVGSAVINGAISEIYISNYKHIDEHLCLWPFPQGIHDEKIRKERYTKYRENIIKENGVVIFISGNKIHDGAISEADGCIEEYRIAKDKNRIIIPVGSTGYAAKTIFDEVYDEIDNYPYLKDYIGILEKEKDIDKIVKAIIDIINSKRKL